MTRSWLFVVLASCATSPTPAADCAMGTCGDTEPDLVNGDPLFENAYARPQLVTVDGELWATFGGAQPSAFPDVFPISYRDAGLVVIHPDGSEGGVYPSVTDAEVESDGHALAIAGDTGLARVSPPTLSAFVRNAYYEHVAVTSFGYAATRRMSDTVERVELLDASFAIQSTVDLARNTLPIVGSNDDVVVFEGPPASLSARRIHGAPRVAERGPALPRAPDTITPLPGTEVYAAISTNDGGYILSTDVGFLQIDATDTVVATISLGYAGDLVGWCTLGELAWDHGELIGACFTADHQLAVFAAGSDGLHDHAVIGPVSVETAAAVARSGSDFVVVFDRYQTVVIPDSDGPAGAVDTLNYPAMWSVTIHANASWDKPQLLATTAP